MTTITITSTVEFAIGEFATNVNYDVNNGALACNDNVQISLGVDCQATISPEMILEGEKHQFVLVIMLLLQEIGIQIK